MSAAASAAPSTTAASRSQRRRGGLADRLCASGPLEDLIEIGRRAGSCPPEKGFEGDSFLALFEHVRQWAARSDVAPDATMAQFIAQAQAASGYKPLKARVSQLREMDFRGLHAPPVDDEDQIRDDSASRELDSEQNSAHALSDSLRSLPTDIAARIARNRQAALERRRVALERARNVAVPNPVKLSREPSQPSESSPSRQHNEAQPEMDDEVDMYDVMEAEQSEHDVEHDVLASMASP